MALSQFSYGRLDADAREGRRLPVPGGYDGDDRLTDDPAAILASGRPLPVGYWKGSGLSLLLDLLASILSGGTATKDITPDEKNLSQVYVAFSPVHLGGSAAVETVVESVVTDLRDSSGGGKTHVRYPGEGALRRRTESLKQGIPVSAAVWDDILALLPDRSPL
jgi:3-dehydro-L-gulonate 2-dehydrogenase